jgi:hypothetical protein
MRLIEKYINALEQCDYQGLSELFAPEGTVRDYCPTSAGTAQEFHVYGREAINMFFRNKFSFRRYHIYEPEIISDNQAVFVAVIGGYSVMAIATIRRVDENGLIERLHVRPK